jgi:hypothetical protein
MDVATDEVRNASRARAPDSPMLSEGVDTRTARPTKNSRCYRTQKRGLQGGCCQCVALKRKLRQDVATDRRAASTEIREADRSHASGLPSSSEGRRPEQLDQTKKDYPDDL